MTHYQHKKKIGYGLKLALAVGIVIIFSAPIVWTALTSLKNGIDLWEMPPKFFFEPTFKHYYAVFVEKDFARYLMNSIIIALGSTVIGLVFGTLAAYALARYKFKGKNILFFGVLVAYMFPTVVLGIPFYIAGSTLHLLGNHLFIILTHSTFTMAFTTWTLKSFFEEIPSDLERAAWLDGCSEFQAFYKIALPLAAPGLVTTAIFCMIFSWNDLFYALVLGTNATTTLPVGISHLESPQGTAWGQICASTMIGVIPIFLFGLFIQKWLVRGLTFGAVK